MIACVIGVLVWGFHSPALKNYKGTQLLVRGILEPMLNLRS